MSTIVTPAELETPPQEIDIDIEQVEVEIEDGASVSVDTEKKYLFTISADEKGMRIEFDALTRPEEDQTMTMIDVSMVTVALFKMLREEGMTNEQLRKFSDNIIEMSADTYVMDEVKVQPQGELDGEKQEQEERQEP